MTISRRTARLGRRDFFVFRWVVAVGVSLVVTGSVEYMVGARQLEARTLAEASARYEHYVAIIEAILFSDGLSPLGREQAIDDELNHIAGSYGTDEVNLFDAAGNSMRTVTPGGQLDDVDLNRLRAVISSQDAFVGLDSDEGEARYSPEIRARPPTPAYLPTCSTDLD